MTMMETKLFSAAFVPVLTINLFDNSEKALIDYGLIQIYP